MSTFNVPTRSICKQSSHFDNLEKGLEKFPIRLFRQKRYALGDYLAFQKKKQPKSKREKWNHKPNKWL
jgi:hypothetical protein